VGSFLSGTAARRVATEFAVGILLFAALLGANCLARRILERPTRQLWANVSIGDPEQSVVFLLGPPFQSYSAENAPQHYYVQGYRRRERPITNRVLIYTRGDLILYVWIDGSGRVEEKFVGGS
jgi:hypothetical protein